MNLPTAATASPLERKSGVTVSVVKGGEIYLDKQLVNAEEMRMRLSLRKVKEPDPRVFIHGDEDASFKTIMQVMDAVRSLGMTKVVIQTRGRRLRQSRDPDDDAVCAGGFFQSDICLS